LLPTLELPGFLLLPEERERVARFLEKIDWNAEN
jgi:hypothetical protein